MTPRRFHHLWVATAVGGFFYPSDTSGNPIDADVTITAWVGTTPTSYTLTNGGLTSFVGFISDDGAFTSLVTSPLSTSFDEFLYRILPFTSQTTPNMTEKIRAMRLQSVPKVYQPQRRRFEIALEPH